MSDREKQIKEIAKHCCFPCDMECNGECLEGNDPSKCYISVEVATKLYNAGYRKPRDGEWKEFSDEYGICATHFVCSKCKAAFVSSELTDKEFLGMMKFCPNCGANMKGGAE